jgi:hypothetical protein
MRNADKAKKVRVQGLREREADRDAWLDSIREARSDSLVRVVEIEGPARAVEGKPRTYRFVASTETPVQTWAGPEVLRMSGAKLDRFLRNPVLLDSHRTDTIHAILGTATAEVKGRKLETEVTLDDTPEGEAARKRIESGSLRAMSIRFRPNRKKVRELREGDVDGEGSGRVKGPAIVIDEWELMEMTLCAVPADEYAIRRSYYQAAGLGQRNHHQTGLGRRSGTQMKRIRYSELPDGAREEQIEEIDDLPEENQARAAEAKRKVLEANRASILSFTPTSLRDFAEGLILEGKSPEEARKLIQAEAAARAKPIGTLEPKDEKKQQSEQDQGRSAPLPADVTDDVLVRSITSMRI